MIELIQLSSFPDSIKKAAKWVNIRLKPEYQCKVSKDNRKLFIVNKYNSKDKWETVQSAGSHTEIPARFFQKFLLNHAKL